MLTENDIAGFQIITWATSMDSGILRLLPWSWSGLANKTGTGTPAVDKLVMGLSESGSVDESLGFPQADSNNTTLQTWTLNSDARWLCGHMGRNSLDDFIRPMSSLWQNEKCQLSKMFAAWESAVSGTPHPFLPPWETEGRRWEQISPCSCPRVWV